MHTHFQKQDVDQKCQYDGDAAGKQQKGDHAVEAFTVEHIECPDVKAMVAI